MTEQDRLASLERQVGDLRVSVAKLEEITEHMQASAERQQKSMEKLSGNIERLTAVMNQGRGAARLVVGLASLGSAGLGAFLFAVARKFGLV